MPIEESSTMPNSQSEFPLTLAEVLFEEVEPKWIAILKIQKEQKENPKAWEDVRPIWEEIHETWDEVTKKIAEIKNLETQQGVDKICKCEGIKIDPSAERLPDQIWDCKYELSKRLIGKLYKIISAL